MEIAQVVQECAQFITKYSETKTFCTPPIPVVFVRLTFFIGSCLGKSVLSETIANIVNYNSKLEKLMQELRDRPVPDIRYGVKQIYEDLSSNCLARADRAGLSEAKKCLDGTRIGILNEIVDWINNTDAATPCIFWLTDKLERGNRPSRTRLLCRPKISACLGRASVSVALDSTNNSI